MSYDGFDPYDEPESIYEAIVFIAALITVGIIATVAGVLWLVR